MSLYTEIKKNFILSNAYEDWVNYRNSLTHYIIQETNQVSLPLSFHANMNEESFLPTLAIIGAGACNDLDLTELMSHFSTITLLDYDTKAMEQALETYHLTDSPYIQCKTISLNGLNDTHYAEFCNSLQAYVQHNLDTLIPREFEDYAISLIENTLTKLNAYTIPLQQNAYDYICCFGVHSQLQAMFSYIYRAFEINLREWKFADALDFNTRFNSHLRAENQRFIPLFHNALLRCAKQSIFLGLEQKRTNHDGAIEGAYQATIDIESRNLTTKGTTMIWPFLPSEDIYYEMLLLKIELDKE